jgi:hypothetical protein
MARSREPVEDKISQEREGEKRYLFIAYTSSAISRQHACLEDI